MPSKKPKKQVNRFKAGIDKFTEMFSELMSLEEIKRKSNARNGVTRVEIFLKAKGDISAVEATKIGQRMAMHFPAWYSPTHYEQYDRFVVSHSDEGIISVVGRI